MTRLLEPESRIRIEGAAALDGATAPFASPRLRGYQVVACQYTARRAWPTGEMRLCHLVHFVEYLILPL